MTTSSKPVQSLQDLTQFGINALTGEACAFGLRVLCDVNQDGLELLSEYLGAPLLNLGNNWNSSVDGKPSVASVMLTRGAVLDLATFALFRQGALAVVVTGDKVVLGIFDKKRLDDYTAYLDSNSRADSGTVGTIVRNPKPYSNAPTEGTRNVHAATGRAY